MNAKADSWEREPFVDGVPIPLELSIHKGQIERINRGVIPEAMEDKWFIYFEEPYLYLHRSWTGQPVYRLKFDTIDNGYTVSEALLSSDLAEKMKDELDCQGQLACFLVSNLLLGKNIPFPKPANLKESMKGAYQHHISGTGYSEAKVQAKTKWWQMWK